MARRVTIPAQQLVKCGIGNFGIRVILLACCLNLFTFFLKPLGRYDEPTFVGGGQLDKSRLYNPGWMWEARSQSMVLQPHQQKVALRASDCEKVPDMEHDGVAEAGAMVPFSTRPRCIVAPDSEVLPSDGWQMMPLGVPKVAYRIPGAPNAEWVDIYNRMYRERIIFLGKEIDDRLANEIIGVLLYLDSEDANKPIYLYINSAGGSVIAGLAIYDTMQHIKSPVITINVGLAASMASFLLASGEKGKRLALPHARIMIHQAMGGAQGQAEDIKVEAQQILQIHENLVGMYARVTGQEKEKIRQDLMRDHFMSATEAKEYGIIDQVIKLQDEGDLPSRAGAAPAAKEQARHQGPQRGKDEEPDTSART